VGTKLDLREDEKTIRDLAAKKQQPIQWDEGIELARVLTVDISAQTQLPQFVEYVECSALTQRNLKSVFDRAIK
jgi:Ras-related C3 botulinum toxin substrate 1